MQSVQEIAWKSKYVSFRFHLVYFKLSTLQRVKTIHIYTEDSKGLRAQQQDINHLYIWIKAKDLWYESRFNELRQTQQLDWKAFQCTGDCLE